MPKFDTKGDVWLPIAMDFAPDGTMYVVELLNGHRLLIFGPDGTFKKSVGSMGQAAKATDLPERFYFPNSVKVHKNEVWVVDSNNRRIQVFDLAGNYKRLVPVSGLPRGMAFLSPGSSVSTSSVDNLVVVDTLSHDGTIWNANGDKLVSFGERGVLEGQFSFPGDVSVGQQSVMFVTDTMNGRVQAWGWPQNVSPLRKILPRQPAWCLALLPLLLVPLLFRKKKFHATADFVEAMLAAGLVSQMPDRRRRMVRLSGRLRGASRPVPGRHPPRRACCSPRSTRSRMRRPWPTSSRSTRPKRRHSRPRNVRGSSAPRTPICAGLAKLLELDVVDRAEYMKRFGTVPVDAAPSSDE